MVAFPIRHCEYPFFDQHLSSDLAGRFDAFVANKNARTGNQIADFTVHLPAKRAVKWRFFPDHGMPRALLRNDSDADAPNVLMATPSFSPCFEYRQMLYIVEATQPLIQFSIDKPGPSIPGDPNSFLLSAR
jgi:hypothetical protein